MTALDFVAAGFAFDPWGRSVAPPRGKGKLVDLLGVEVARRVPKMRGRSLNHSAGYGRCEACGDPLKPHRGGMCELCMVAFVRAKR